MFSLHCYLLRTHIDPKYTPEYTISSNCFGDVTQLLVLLEAAACGAVEL